MLRRGFVDIAALLLVAALGIGLGSWQVATASTCAGEPMPAAGGCLYDAGAETRVLTGDELAADPPGARSREEVIGSDRTTGYALIALSLLFIAAAGLLTSHYSRPHRPPTPESHDHDLDRRSRTIA